MRQSHMQSKKKLTGKYILSHYSSDNFRYFGKMVSETHIKFIKYNTTSLLGKSFIGTVQLFMPWTNTDWKVLSEDEAIAYLI